MILVDTNQISIANLMAESKGKPTFQPDLIRHMIFNTIRGLRVKYHREYGEIVLCYDADNYWRKDIFSHYKASRKTKRDDSELDWRALYKLFDSIRDDFRQHFPYKVLRVERCEADDIIATLCKHAGGAPTLIVSSDKDFQQLQKWPNIRQWSPIHKKFLKCPNPQAFLEEQVIRGDSGDGIPNVLSEDDVFVVDGKRQRPISEKKLQAWIGQDPKMVFGADDMARYDRNRRLVDLGMIPDTYERAILEEYAKPPEGCRAKILPYFIANRMRMLTECIGDF